MSDLVPHQPLRILTWTKSASNLLSKEDFIRHAVNLAYLLTERLIKAIGVASADTKIATGLPSTSIGEPFTSDHVILFVPTACSLSVKAIEFEYQFDEQGNIVPDLSQCDESTACACLGKILLDVFANGKSTSLNIVDTCVTGRQHDKPSGIDTETRAVKRVSTGNIGDSFADRAHSLLLDMGMPYSIGMLVRDMLGGGRGQDLDDPDHISHAIKSPQEVLRDLSQMKNNPKRFLFDRVSPQIALDDTGLYGSNWNQTLFGREKEIDALKTAVETVSKHVKGEVNNMDSSSHAGQKNFLVETVFLSGYSGCGKTRLLHELQASCLEDDWFILSCKFDKSADPQAALCKMFDDFFGKWVPNLTKSQPGNNDTPKNVIFKVCQSIFSTVDSDGFEQLSHLMPNFARAFPLLVPQPSNDLISSSEKIGSARLRSMYLIHMLLKSLCSAGRPVLLLLDDLHWSKNIVGGMADFTVNYINETSDIELHDAVRRGLFIASSFRSNELKDNFLLERVNFIKQSNKVHFTELSIGELTTGDIANLISTKFCLPNRYTQELASLVRMKTQGNPFFIIQFLKTIIHKKMLQFSVKQRKWIWDCDVIEMQLMPDGAAELLTARFAELPPRLMQALKIMSCIGSQLEDSMIDLINKNHQILPFSMKDELQLALNEGILERAGPVFQFTHDIVQHSIYDLIQPTGSRNLLHKEIGTNLLKSADHSPSIHLLATDQINKIHKSSIPSSLERSTYAKANVTAAKISMTSSSFERARSYIETGISFLEEDHWNRQYDLSLSLFDLQATLSCMRGDVSTMSCSLDAILSHAKSFNDSLRASGLLVKLLETKSEYKDAMNNCLSILSYLGVNLCDPDDSSLSIVRREEMMEIQTMLKNIRYEEVRQLQRMTDHNKLKAMNFMSMLCQICHHSKPMMLPVVSSMMIKLTFQHGFCDDSIVGLATSGWILFTYTDLKELGYKICTVADRLIEDSPNRHALEARLCHEIKGTARAVMEPLHSHHQQFPELYKSSILAGDMKSAVAIRWTFCSIGLIIGNELTSLSTQVKTCIQEAAKYNQDSIFLSAMPHYQFCLALTGKKNDLDGLKDYNELYATGEKTSNMFLLLQAFFWDLSTSFWSGEYLQVCELSTQYTSSQYRRAIFIMRTFYEGISFSQLARHTKQDKWKLMAEKSCEEMAIWAGRCQSNWYNKYKLMTAELHYTNGDIRKAKICYHEAIKSAEEHKWLNEEALSYELYGIFCIEEGKVAIGMKQLKIAMEKYKEWGAVRKIQEVQEFMDLVTSAQPLVTQKSSVTIDLT